MFCFLWRPWSATNSGKENIILEFVAVLCPSVWKRKKRRAFAANHVCQNVIHGFCGNLIPQQMFTRLVFSPDQCMPLICHCVAIWQMQIPWILVVMTIVLAWHVLLGRVLTHVNLLCRKVIQEASGRLVFYVVIFKRRQTTSLSLVSSLRV